MREDLLKYKRPFLTEIELETFLKGSADSRYSKVKRMLAQGQLLHIRRGLYGLQSFVKPHPFELAQYIYAPSYISLESALAYHQLIPETVYTITSVCSKRSKEFHTPLGLFSYLHLPLKNFYTEVELVTENNIHFLMAKPWKALCDYIHCYKINLEFEAVLDSLRINVEDLPPLSDQEIEVLNDYYQNQRMRLFLQTVERDLTK